MGIWHQEPCPEDPRPPPPVGVEEVISQEPEITDPKCGISNMNVPPNRIHLVWVPGLKSKIFNYPILPLAQNQKKFCARVDPRVLRADFGLKTFLWMSPTRIYCQKWLTSTFWVMPINGTSSWQFLLGYNVQLNSLKGFLHLKQTPLFLILYPFHI